MTETLRMSHAGPFLPKMTKYNKRKSNRMKEPLQTGSDKSTQILSKEDVSRFRCSLKQNICVEMLQEGCHRSFSELLTVLDLDCSRREEVKSSSSDKLQTPLEDQRDKMETMKLHLMQAEQAEDTGSWSLACEEHLSLGQYFTAAEDIWLSLHFFHSCVARDKGGCSRAATEARACLAKLYLQQGELEEAKHQAELCAQQAEDGGWLDSAGTPLRLQACQLLWKIYNRLANAPLDAADYDKALTLLHEGYTKATQSEDKQMEGEASYRLGLAYQGAGDQDTAKRYFNSYIEICKALQDAARVGMGYKAMAKSLESEGNIDESIQCLQKLCDISQSNGLQRSLVDAYMCLGDIYYNWSEYEQACEHYLQSYHIASKLGDSALLQKTQVLVGSARAHSMMRPYSADVEESSHSALQRLVAWKETREWQALSGDATDNTAAAQHYFFT